MFVATPRRRSSAVQYSILKNAEGARCSLLYSLNALPQRRVTPRLVGPTYEFS